MLTTIKIKLITQFKGIEGVLSSSNSLLEQQKINPEIKQSIKKAIPKGKIKFKEINNFLSKNKNIKLVTFFDDNYPPMLKEISSAPLFLYIQGNIECLQDEAPIAIVGSRKVSYDNRINIEAICKDIAQKKFTIVSGLAVGVDSMAHLASINNISKTIGVLGCGIDLHTNTTTLSVRKDIINNNGAVISPFHPGVSASRYTFPSRNRIISGLSLGVLICEAKKKSGSLITATYGLEQNKEIFAMPNRIFTPAFEGTNNLIKNGQAKLITCVDDIVEEMPEDVKDKLLFRDKKTSTKEIGVEKKIEFDSKEEKEIFTFISDKGNVQLDTIIQSLNISTSELLSSVVMLEMKQLIRKLPGNFYQLNKD